jgi:hypothetical protein
MRFLCLAYGNEKDWLALTDERRAELLAQDDVLRARGDLVSVLGDPTTVRTWDGTPRTTGAPFAAADAPLVGFSIVEASDVDEAVSLVAHTPCPVAGGAIEIRPLVTLPQ